jgi:hypothetical protein
MLTWYVPSGWLAAGAMTSANWLAMGTELAGWLVPVVAGPGATGAPRDDWSKATVDGATVAEDVELPPGWLPAEVALPWALVPGLGAWELEVLPAGPVEAL